MAGCVNHPEREAQYLCTKHNIGLCEECLHCRDPELYCKFRTSCTIWFIHKENMRARRRKENGD